MKLLRCLLYLVAALPALALERPEIRVNRTWTVGELVAINPSGAQPVAVEWRDPPRLPDSPGESEAGAILTELFIDRRGRFNILAMQGGTEAEKAEFRQALRRARVRARFPAESSVGVKAWFATSYAAISPDRNNTPVVIKHLTPVFHSGVVTAGKIRERRVRLLVQPTGEAALAPGAPIDAKLAPAITAAVQEWRFIPPRLNGVAGFGEIEVPLLFALSEERTGFFTPAVLLQQSLPTRPAWMRLLKIGEQNRVRLKIGKDGSVLEAVQLDPTLSSAYNEEVVRQARTWRFSPEVRNGVAVETTRIMGFGRPPPAPPPIDSPAPTTTAVAPPHGIKLAGLKPRDDHPAVQIRLTIDKTGAISHALIERTRDIAYANELVARYEHSQWDPASEKGAPIDYTFRVKQ